jgi:chromosome partitioning protein
MRVITLLNEKGGVGKTTSAVHIAAGLAIRGHRVLLVDGDPQGHATLALGVAPAPALHDLIVRQAEFRDALRVVPPENYAPEGKSKGQFFIIPGDIETRVIPMLVNDVWRLRKRFSQLQNSIDFIVIDTAPTPSLFHSMIYMVTDFIIYPTKCERLSFDGLVKSLNHTEEANDARKPHVPPIVQLGILPTMYRGKTVEHSENLKLLKETYPGKVLTPMRDGIIWAEASSLNRTVFAVAPDSKAAENAWAMVTKVETA